MAIRITTPPAAGRRAAAAVALLFAACLAPGCGPRFAAPAAAPAEVEAARRTVAEAGGPVGVGLSEGEAIPLLARVARRVDAAARPLCAEHLGGGCGLRVVLDPDPVARASLSGDEVRVSLGMLRLLGGAEDEVAAVVAHEYGHRLAGHAGRRVARGLAAGTAASALLGAVVPFGGLAGALIGQGAAQLGAAGARRAFSKEEEREADYLAAYLVARAGYDLDRAALVWVRLTRGGAGETAGWLATHPGGPERLAAWRRAAEEVRASPDGRPRRAGGGLGRGPRRARGTGRAAIRATARAERSRRWRTTTPPPSVPTARRR